VDTSLGPDTRPLHRLPLRRALPSGRGQAGAGALREERDFLHLTGDPTQEAVLRPPGADKASGLLCAVDSDAINVYTLTARAMNPG
jgi:voltage-gated potassium channel Kch